MDKKTFVLLLFFIWPVTQAFATDDNIFVGNNGFFGKPIEGGNSSFIINSSLLNIGSGSQVIKSEKGRSFNSDSHVTAEFLFEKPFATMGYFEYGAGYTSWKFQETSPTIDENDPNLTLLDHDASLSSFMVFAGIYKSHIYGVKSIGDIHFRRSLDYGFRVGYTFASDSKVDLSGYASGSAAINKFNNLKNDSISLDNTYIEPFIRWRFDIVGFGLALRPDTGSISFSASIGY